MKSLAVFQQFEREAVKWGKNHLVAHVGDIVTANPDGNKTPRRFQISSIQVAVGRNNRLTTLKSFTLEYVGRRLKKDGTPLDKIGCGRYLAEFVTESGLSFSSDVMFGLNETINDCGLTFEVESMPEVVEMYPDAHQTYANATEYPYDK